MSHAISKVMKLNWTEITYFFTGVPQLNWLRRSKLPFSSTLKPFGASLVKMRQRSSPLSTLWNKADLQSVVEAQMWSQSSGPITIYCCTNSDSSRTTSYFPRIVLALQLGGWDTTATEENIYLLLLNHEKFSNLRCNWRFHCTEWFQIRDLFSLKYE